jgi:hypothetical protein
VLAGFPACRVSGLKAQQADSIPAFWHSGMTEFKMPRLQALLYSYLMSFTNANLNGGLQTGLPDCTHKEMQINSCFLKLSFFGIQWISLAVLHNAIFPTSQLYFVRPLLKRYYGK